MALRIEDYAIIGDTHTAGIVGNNGSIDWLCLPRFDSPACFAALVGDERHGRWIIQPSKNGRQRARRYRPGSLVLETDLSSEEGDIRIVDCMARQEPGRVVVRIVEGRRGRVSVTSRLAVRFDYGSIKPWVTTQGHDVRLIAGPDGLALRSPAPSRIENGDVITEFSLSEGERAAFSLTWFPSHQPVPAPPAAEDAVAATDRWWRAWARQCRYRGGWHDAVLRSLLTLKALTYSPTGGIVAAATTSLPERIGGVRNWDYRYCWLRDATFTIEAFLAAGYLEEASAWRDWLLRVAAGEPARMQMLYGPAGERRLPELSLPWLPGYEGSAPVRIGNAASMQWQLDVYGELMDTLDAARDAGIEPDPEAWELQTALMDFLETAWDDPDDGIWEVRGPERHFTHSKLMAWVAMDRALKGVERHGLAGPAERWRKLREQIRHRVCTDGFDAELGAFVQAPGTKRADASLLMMPLVGFLPATDERVLGTIKLIEERLVTDGFVLRYEHTDTESLDALPPGEGTFLLCTLWYADNLFLCGRRSEAREVFERVLAVRNDVGLLAEEYDPAAGRLLGNFPQAFSHIGLINTARTLSGAEEIAGRPREQRGQEDAG